MKVSTEMAERTDSGRLFQRDGAQEWKALTCVLKSVGFRLHHAAIRAVTDVRDYLYMAKGFVTGSYFLYLKKTAGTVDTEV